MGGPKRDMDLYVFKDKSDDVRCLQCALYYPKDKKHVCPAAHKNVLPADQDVEDVFGGPLKWIPPKR